MRLVLKLLYRAFSILMMIGAMTFTLMPATDAESAALGPDNNRFNLVQMRLAKVMMTLAPDFAVARYAEATGLPDDMIRTMLEAKAAGEPIVPRNQDFYVDGAEAGVPAIHVDPARRTEAGGALFAKPD